MKKIIRENGRTRVITVFTKPSLAQQQFKEQCDVNHIMKKYKVTGLVSHLNTKTGQYMDTTNVPDYQRALDIVIQANDSFNSLPATVRKKFNNDPQNLIQFLNDPSNKEEAIKLGLMNKQPEPNLVLESENKNTNKNKNKNPNPPSASSEE